MGLLSFIWWCIWSTTFLCFEQCNICMAWTITNTLFIFSVGYASKCLDTFMKKFSDNLLSWKKRDFDAQVCISVVNPEQCIYNI